MPIMDANKTLVKNEKIEARRPSEGRSLERVSNFYLYHIRVVFIIY